MSDIIKKSFVLLNCFDYDKNNTIKTLASAMEADGRLNDKEGYINDIFDREKISSTAIGFGIAAPHTKSMNIKTPALGFAHFAKPVIWDEKGSKIEVFFLIAIPEDTVEEETMLIGNLFKSFIDEDFRKKIFAANNPEEIISIIDELEKTI